MGFWQTSFDKIAGRGAEVKDRPAWNKEQKELFSELFRQLMGGGGAATQPYGGQLPGTVPLASLEQMSLSGLEGLFGPEGFLNPAIQRDAFEDFYQKGVKEPMMHDFEEEILPMMRRKFSPNYWSSERLGAEEQGYEDLMRGLTEGRVASQMGMVELAMGMPNVLTQAATLGGLPRMQEEAGLQSEYNEFLRQMQEQQNIRAQMLAALGLKSEEYFPFGPVEGFAQSTFRGAGGSMMAAG